MANLQPKYGVFLAPREVTVGSIVMAAKVMKGDVPQKDILVQFYRDGSAIPGANGYTDSDGKFEYSLNIPADATSVKVKAEVSANGTFSKEITVGIPAAVQNVNRGELPLLVVEDNKLGDNKYRLAMAIFAENGKMLPGLLQISSNKDLNVTFPYKADRDNAQLAIGLQNPGNAHEIEMDGTRWLTVDVEFIQAFELDVFVAGWQRKIELKFAGPKSSAKGEEIPLTRPMFAAFCLALFCLAVFTTNVFNTGFGFPESWLAAFVVGIIFLILSLGSVGFYNRRIIRNPAVKPLAGPFAALVATNNRWFISMVLMTLISFVLIFTAQWGKPTLSEDRRTGMTEDQISHEYVPGDQAQRIRNIQRNLGPVTDRSLIKKPVVVFTWESFWTRITVFLILLVLTIGYAFIAFSDEASSAVSSAWGKFNRSTEGVAGQGLFGRLVDRVLGKPTSGGQGGSSVPSDPKEAESTGTFAASVVQSISINLLIDAVTGFLENLYKTWSSNKNGSGNNRRRTES
jgi:hypothetical protein